MGIVLTFELSTFVRDSLSSGILLRLRTSLPTSVRRFDFCNEKHIVIIYASNNTSYSSTMSYIPYSNVCAPRCHSTG